MQFIYYLSYNIPKTRHQRQSIQTNQKYNDPKELQLTLDWLNTKTNAQYKLTAKNF